MENLMRIIIILLSAIIIDSSGSDPTIRIAAYDPVPQPVYPSLPEKQMARRMGVGPSIIEDVYRPPRHALPAKESSPRRTLKRPLRNRQLISSETRGGDQLARPLESESILVDENDVGNPLILLSPDALKNPHRGTDADDFGLPLPLGPPVTTLRSSFLGPGGPGAVQPPAINPPGFPSKSTSSVSMPGMPGSRPFPPALPPGIPITTTTVQAGPPTPPPPGSTPSPPDGSKVTDIKCLEFAGQQTFEAILSLPDGYEAVPVFDDKPTIDPTTNPTCRMIPTQLTGMFQLIVSSYESCGVRKCRQSNGETWNCLVLRFPRLNGLKLPEDEIIEIRCRPHDRTANDIHVLSVATAKYADKSAIFTKPPTVFEGLQEFECEIGLFRQIPGTNQFNTRVKEDSPLELGENVQLWSIVKEGDGWEYSRLSEIVIQKQDGVRERSTLNTAVLVFSDGCRNPNYRIIAPDHPFRDTTNKLVSKFTFRAFMFQDMEPGDSLQISARVVGCILEEDCKPAVCPDDGGKGYGRRRKREASPTGVMEFVSEYTVPLDWNSPTGSDGRMKRDPIVLEFESGNSVLLGNLEIPKGPSVVRRKREIQLQESISSPSPSITSPEMASPSTPTPSTISTSHLLGSPTGSPLVVEKYTSLFDSHMVKKNTTTGWSRNLAIKIRMPDEDSVTQKSIKFRDCKLYLFISLGIALFFCLISIAFVSFTMLRQRRKTTSLSSIPPSTESKRSEARRWRKPVEAYNLSSSSSDTIYSSSEFSATSSTDLRQLPIPQTVRQRKREVNAELMGLFCHENGVPFNGQYPPMMNYYGYMVVPRPPPSNHQKKSLRAIKRNSRERCLPTFFDDSDMDPPKNERGKTRHSKTSSLDRCSCHEKDSHSDTESQVSNHTSVIRITSSGTETISQSSSSSLRPQPKPRTTRSDHIYSEIRENTPTVLV